MKITTIFALFAMLLPYSQQAQSWKWANSLGTPNFSTKVAHIRPYSGSDVIVCGAFAAPELELGTHSFFNAGQEDGFLAIVDEDGQYSWAGTLGSQGRDFVVDAAAAPDGSLIAGELLRVSACRWAALRCLMKARRMLFWSNTTRIKPSPG